MSKIVDEQLLILIRSAQRGDQKAIKEIVEQTQVQVHRFCFYLCRSRERAEDLCQETYLKGLTSLGSLEKPEMFLSWLFRIAKNIFLDLVRSKNYETEQNRNEDDFDNENSESQNNLSRSSDQSFSLDIQKTLSQFEPEDRALLILVDMEEYSYAEAGKIIGITEAAVRSRVFRLRQDFLKKWKKS